MAIFYAVKKGVRPGIYESWEECRYQVNGFIGAEYRKFESRNAAESYIGNLAFKPEISFNTEKQNNEIFKTNEEKKTLNPNVKYLFTVKGWMTQPTQLGSDFTFMAKMNNNIPMPGTKVVGNKVKETEKMVYLKCSLATEPHTPWAGWVAKSAIIKEEEIEISNVDSPFMGSCPRTEDGTVPFSPTILIYRNNRNNYSLKITFNKKSPINAQLLVEKYRAKMQDDIYFFVMIENYEDILDEFKNYKVKVENPENYDYIKAHEYTIDDLIEDYPEADWKTSPYQHQRVAYQFGMQKSRMLIADEQGLGKSLESIMIAEGKKKQFGYKHCLVVCGVNTLKWNWADEIEKHSHEKARLLGLKRKNIGSTKDKLKELKNIDQISEYFIITNIETIRSKEVAEELKKLCENRTIGMIIADEFHKMKNSSSQQGSNFMSIKADCMIALTGTPMLNNPLDLYGCFRWLGYEKGSPFSFNKYYSKRSGDYNEIVTYRHQDTLNKNLQHIMLRRKKEDVLDLPDKVYINEFVEMSTKQKKLYDVVLEETITDFETGEEKKMNPLARLTKLRQCTAHTGIIDNSLNDSAKIDRLMDLVEEYVAEGRKVIVFSNWTSVVDKVMDALKKYNPLTITGDTKDSDRIDIKNTFQDDPSRKVIVGSIGAMGTGLTLTAAEAVIFMDEPWTNGAKEQAIDRAHRIGTKNTVTIHTLMCKGTIDERIHSLVEMKKDISDVIVDNVTNTKIARMLLGLN